MSRKKAALAERLLVEERFALSTEATVDTSDPEHPFIRGVLLCGSTSANTFIGEGRERQAVKGRRYLAEAFAGERVKRYAGKPVFLNHPQKSDGASPRLYQDKIATVVNERTRSDGMPVGDLAVNPKHPHAEQFLWDAKNAPNSCGMSHRAYCAWRKSSDGFAEASELQEVVSVDVVTESATTKGIFEHKEKQPMSTIKAVYEWVARNSKSTVDQCLKMKALAAEFGDVVVSEAEEGDEPEGAIDKAFKDLMHAHLDEMLDGAQDCDDFCKKIKALAKAHMGKPKEGGEGEEKPKEGEEKAKPPEEGKAIGYEAALNLCSEAKYTATHAEYKLLAKCGSEAEVKAFIAEQTNKVNANEKPPRSVGRTQPVQPKGAPTQENRMIPAWSAVTSRN